MTTLGSIPISTTASIVEARSKVRAALLAFGAPEIRATRIATATAHVLRAAHPVHEIIDVDLVVHEESGRLRWSIIIAPLTGVEVPEAALAFFDDITHRGDSAELTVALAGITAPPGAIHLATEVVTEKTRDQLLSEIQEQNRALENAKVQLEETVKERTAELETALDELVVQREAADEANRAKSAFLANMSHELRTPMNAIIGYTEMLIEEAEDEELDDFIPDLEKVKVSGTHLLSLINDVLDLSKIEAGRMDLFVETTELKTVLDGVTATAHQLFDKNDNTFVLESGDDLGTVDTDTTKLRQVLLNLLSNAAKFTSAGAVTLRVEHTANPAGDRISFAVSDTGIGIPPDKLDAVFEEFSQADESTTRDFGGTGLGLALTRQLCELMGGTITIDSELGVGSTFTVDLPAHIVVEQD